MTQRPELFRAVVCSVPLLDMVCYHRFLIGASWIGEYGDPGAVLGRCIRVDIPSRASRSGKSIPAGFAADGRLKF